MNVNQEPTRSIRYKNPESFEVIDQRFLPHEFKWFSAASLEETAIAIKDMIVRGAPLIGATAACGIAVVAHHISTNNYKDQLQQAFKILSNTRPTAVNLKWALKKQYNIVEQSQTLSECQKSLYDNAQEIMEDDVRQCKQIGQHGLKIIKSIYQRKKTTVNILTHCNAGWLACVDWGTATSPMYQAQLEGIPIHIWVDETRPRNQGAKLTAWELGQQGVDHTIIADNTGGHLMQHGMVDLVIVGSDRTTRTGDVANKIGTYLKALAAFDNNIPFYAALPMSTIDWEISDGLQEIPIETRSEDEVKIIDGFANNTWTQSLICPQNSKAINYGFDVTPSKFITGIITEKGVCEASEKGLLELYPEMSNV